MRRVLIWKKAFPGGEYDIFHSTDYETLYDHVQTAWAGNTQNWGNKLWFQGIYSAIDTGENEYSFIGETVDPDVINNSFDFIVLPMANIFFVDFRDSMLQLTAILEKIQIPVFVVVCGVQADSYDKLDDVIAAISTPIGTGGIGIVRITGTGCIEIADKICEIISGGMNFDSILQSLFLELDLKMTFEQHALVGSTVRSYLTYLKNAGRAEPYFENNILMWKAL